MHYYAFHASIFRVIALLFYKPNTESTFISGICWKLRGQGVPPFLFQITFSLYFHRSVWGVVNLILCHVQCTEENGQLVNNPIEVQILALFFL